MKNQARHEITLITELLESMIPDQVACLSGQRAPAQEASLRASELAYLSDADVLELSDELFAVGV